MDDANYFAYEREQHVLFRDAQRGVVEGSSSGVRGSQRIWQHKTSVADFPDASQVGVSYRPHEKELNDAVPQSAAARYELDAFHGHTTPSFCYTPPFPLPHDETSSLEMWLENNSFENDSNFHDMECGNDTIGTVMKAPGSQCSTTWSGSGNTCSIGSENSLSDSAAYTDNFSSEYSTNTNHEGGRGFSTSPCSTSTGRPQYTFVNGLGSPMKELV